MTLGGLKDDCKCGHDRTHHHLDPSNNERCNCLAMRCDCRWFRAQGQPDPPVPRWARPKNNPIDDIPNWEHDDDAPSTPRMAKPHANTSCLCADCRVWLNKRIGNRFGGGP